MAILAQLQRLFTPSADKIRAQHLYIALVQHARNPVFYTRYAIPDTLDGRFESITLHMHLLLKRLQKAFAEEAGLKEISRLLIESYFSDMDRSLREMGVGDTGIGRKVQRMSSGFYGRLEAYGMATEQPELWPEALRRNLYGTVESPDAEVILAMRDYIIRSHAHLETIANAALQGDTRLFLAPDASDTTEATTSD